MKRFYAAFCKVEEMICNIGFLLMILFVFASALARSFNHPIAWSIDFAQLLLCWVTLLGADVAYRHGRFLGLDLITRKFPIKVRRGIEILVDVIILVMMVILSIYGTKLAIANWSRTFQTLPISYSTVTLALPVTCTLLFITVSIELVNRIKNYNTPENKGGDKK